MATAFTPELRDSVDGVYYFQAVIPHNTQNQAELVWGAWPNIGSRSRFRVVYCTMQAITSATAPDADANNWRVRMDATREPNQAVFFMDASDRVGGVFIDGGGAPEGWIAKFDTRSWPVFNQGDILRFHVPITDTNAAPTADLDLWFALVPV